MVCHIREIIIYYNIFTLSPFRTEQGLIYPFYKSESINTIIDIEKSTENSPTLLREDKDQRVLKKGLTYNLKQYKKEVCNFNNILKTKNF